MSFQVTSELDFSRKHEIEGRFIRANIKCSQDIVVKGDVLSSDVSSCVALKITGNITRMYDQPQVGCQLTQRAQLNLIQASFPCLPVLEWQTHMKVNISPCFVHANIFLFDLEPNQKPDFNPILHKTTCMKTRPLGEECNKQCDLESLRNICIA